MSKSVKDVQSINPNGKSAAEVHNELHALLKAGEAVICPCCGQHAYVNSRKITSTMADQLLRMYVHGPMDSKTLQASTNGCERMYSLLRHWGLAEKVPDDDERDVWQITQAGMAFVQGFTRAAKYAYVYNNKCVGKSEDTVSFLEAKKSGFDLPEVFSTSEHLHTAGVT